MYGSDLKIRIDATNRSTYADVVVICGREQGSEIDPNAIINPTVIVEVLSPSTEASDRGEKWHHYQRIPSLREYVLVSQGKACIEVYWRDGERWAYSTFGPGEELMLPSQGVRIPVNSIYADPRAA